MSRDSLQTVTHALPVIVELGPAEGVKDADGRARFLHGGRGDSWVRVFRPADVKKQLRTIFSSKDISLFLGAVQLKQALETSDQWGLQTASEKIRPWLPDFTTDRIPKFEIDLKHKTAVVTEGEINWGFSSFVNFSRIIADMFAKARLVMWFDERQERGFLPALYCPDWKTAAFVVTFMGQVRVCPHPKCNTVFIPETGREFYCCTKHGVSYRTARSRWNRREGEKTRAAKRRTRK